MTNPVNNKYKNVKAIIVKMFKIDSVLVRLKILNNFIYDKKL